MGQSRGGTAGWTGSDPTGHRRAAAAGGDRAAQPPPSPVVRRGAPGGETRERRRGPRGKAGIPESTAGSGQGGAEAERGATRGDPGTVRSLCGLRCRAGAKGAGGARKAPLPAAGLLFPGTGPRRILRQREGRGRIPRTVPGGQHRPGTARHGTAPPGRTALPVPRSPGRRSGAARCPQPPGAPRSCARPPRTARPGSARPAAPLTVLVVLEVVIGSGPAAALGRVLHVVELQKVRPLAREAQEGGGQAPRQGHQPPGAGERREGAEGAAGRPGPTRTRTGPLAAGIRGSPRLGRPARHGTARPGTARSGAERAPPQLRPAAGLCAGKTVRRGSGAAPPGGGSEVGGTRLCPPPGTPRTSAAAWRRQRCAPAAVPCRAGPSRGHGGAQRGGGGGRRDPRSGRAEPRSASPTYPAGREGAFWPSQRLQAAAARRSCSPALPPARGWKSRGAPGSEDLTDTPALRPSGPGEGSARFGRRPRSCC